MNKEMQTSRYRTGTKIASVFLSAAMLATSFVGLGSVLTAPTMTVDAAGDYGLADNIQDGNILHCFDWKISDITAEIPNIAKAGFTSVQTSPIQPHDASGTWYWLYQPVGFSVGNDLGSADDLKALCAEADKYGVKVIVDVVANHVAGWADGRRKDYIQNGLTSDEYFHNTQYNTDANNVDWSNRWQITHCNIGMPDLNSEHSYVQGVVAGLVNELKACGVDGIRWDAAKHISLPSEDCGFWPAVTKAGLYNYGEILDSPGGDGASVMKEYANYIGVTDSSYSGEVTGAIRDGKVTTNNGNWANQGVSASRIVYWPESHDTYCNNGWTNGLSEDIMDRAYAVLGARANSQTLYLSRPFEKQHTSIAYGVKGSTHFTSKQVAAVNHFKNAMVGTKEYYTTGSNCFVVCREGGAVIVAASGSNFNVTVPNGGGIVKQGTYTDEVSGGSWTVSGSTISGQIGSSGIAVIYNAPDPTPDKVTVSATPGDSSFTTSVTATLKVTNASSGTYTTSDGKSGTFTNGQSITFGSDVKKGGKVTLTLSATGTSGSASATYTYTKTDPSATVKIYFDNKAYNWSNVYAYVYDESSGTAKSMAAWPGVKMTEKSKSGYFVLDVDAYKANGQVIFNDGTGSASNRYPADMQPGMKIAGSSKLFSTNHSWTDFSDDEEEPEPEVPTVNVNKASGTTFTAETLDITLSLANASSGTYSVDGGPTKTFTGSKTVTIGEGKIGDSVVTVETTAKGSDGTTKSYTFTYNKKYQVKTTSSSASALTGKYATNPSGQKGGKGVTITGPSDFKESMIIAQGVANDDPRIFRGSHEAPVYDTYALYAAWDDTNLYLGWQFTNVTDVVDPAQGYPISDNGKPWNGDIPQMLAFDLGKGKSADMTKGNMAAGAYVWGLKVGFDTRVDALMCFSSKPGVGQPALFTTDSTGYFNYDNVTSFKDGGISFKYQDGFFGSKITGIKSNGYAGYKPADLTSTSSAWVDFLSEGHDKSQDTFYYMTIPLATLGITRSYLESTGIGVMHISTFGEGGIASIPMDMTMLDNATQPYSADESTSAEKEDTDTITVPLARIGAGEGGGDDPIDPVDPVDPTTPLQVNFGTDKSAPQLTTSSLTIKGIGIGGTAPYKYQFSVDGTVVKASSTTATYTWKPSTAKQHTLKCVITDATGATATATKTFTAEGDNIDQPTNPLTNNSSVSATSIKLGTSVTLTGKASGGTSPYYYALQYKKATATSWTTIGTKYSTTASGSFKPGSAVDYDVRVTVKDAAGTTAAKSWTVKVSNSSTLTNNSTVSATSIKLGTSVTLTGKATGGTSPYYYALQYKKATATSWTTIGTKYSTTKTGSFKPGSAVDYDVRVTIKDASGKTAAKSWTVKVSKDASLTNNSTVSATSITLGTKITLTGKATGGTSPYYYALQYKKATATSWSTIGTKYSTTASGSFKPGAAVDYDVRVTVKDANGKTAAKSWTVKVNPAATTALTNSSKVSATSVKAGTTVTLTGAASGGTSPYKYAYYIKKSTNSNWTVVGTEFGTSKTATFTPKTAVVYDVMISVMDAKGVVESKTFAVRVS